LKVVFASTPDVYGISTDLSCREDGNLCLGPIFIDAIQNNQIVFIHGGGSQARSMSYIDDLVNGTILARESEHAVGEIINKSLNVD